MIKKSALPQTELTIPEVRFRVCPLQIKLNEPIQGTLAYKIYFQKGKQVLGEINRVLSAITTRKRTLKLAPISNQMNFQIFHERNSEIQISIYMIKDDREYFYESTNFDLKEFITAYISKSTNCLIQFTKELPQSQLSIKFCVVVGTDDDNITSNLKSKYSNLEELDDKALAENKQFKEISQPTKQQPKVQSPQNLTPDNILLTTQNQFTSLLTNSILPELQVNTPINTIQQNQLEIANPIQKQQIFLQSNDIQSNLIPQQQNQDIKEQSKIQFKEESNVDNTIQKPKQKIISPSKPKKSQKAINLTQQSKLQSNTSVKVGKSYKIYAIVIAIIFLVGLLALISTGKISISNKGKWKSKKGKK